MMVLLLFDFYFFWFFAASNAMVAVAERRPEARFVCKILELLELDTNLVPTSTKSTLAYLFFLT
jgi:hypothetical protein